MFFREKKTLSLGAKDTKKERTPLRALVFESRGRKERQSRFHRAHTWSSTTRPRPTSRDSVVRIIPVVCFRQSIIFAHVCMCACANNNALQKETFFWSIFRQKIVKNSSSCDERKNEQSFPRPTSPRGKNNKKRNDVSLLFSPQSRKPRAR